MKHLRADIRICLCCLLLLALAALSAPAAAAETPGTAGFSVEQVYLNVPEMDVYFYAADADGNAYTASQVLLAEPQLTLGERKLDTRSIGTAVDPVCYIVAIDNSAAAKPGSLRAVLRAVRGLVAQLGENDQLMLYTTAGETTCILPATDDTDEMYRALAAVKQAEGSISLTEAAAVIYTDVQADYQSIAPRKALFFCIDGEQLLGNTALLAGLLGDAGSQLNMAFTTFAAAADPDRLDELTALAGDSLVVCTPSEMRQALLDRKAQLTSALTLHTELSESLYGERLETMTLSVPSLGSAVQSTRTVYMGHKLEKPQIEKVEVLSRTSVRLTFNQPVNENADKPQLYALTGSDIWAWHVRIKKAELSQDGRTALLTTEPLYAGEYTASLDRVASRRSAANVSSARDRTKFTIAVWPRDRSFYAARFRTPLLAAVLLLAALAARWAQLRRREKAAEQQAEAEHLLGDAAGQRTLPRRWVTLFWSRRGSIAESRWAGMVESSLILGSDAAQCDLCLPDDRIRPQHCALTVRGDALLVQPLGERAAVYVNGERIGGEHRLQNNDSLRLGKTVVRLVL